MDLRRLRYFAAVAEAGSFSRAAAELRIAQPALSRRIGELEEELGCALLVRHGRGVRLTVDGAAVLKRAEEIQRLVAELEREARRGSALGGRIVLAVPPSAGLLLVPPVIESFARTVPSAVISVREGISSLIHEWLAAGRIDIGVVYNPPPVDGFAVVPLLRERMVLVGPPAAHDHSGLASAVHVRSLPRLPLIMPSLPHNNRRVLDQAAARHGIGLDIVSEVDSVALTKALVAAGRGFTVLTHAAVAAEVARGELSARRIERPAIVATLALVARRTPETTPLARALMETVASTTRAIVAAGAWPGAEVSVL